MVNALEKLTEKMTQQSEGHYEGSKEAWSQNIDYFNGLNNLFIAFLLAVFSTLFIQISLYILEKSLADNIFYFSVFGIMIFSFLISVYLLVILIIDRYQANNSIKRHENMMKSSKKNLDNLKKFKPNSTK